MRVRALRAMTYNNRDYKSGEEFDTLEEMHGVLMAQSGTVERVQDELKKRGRYARRDMRADE